jgi:Holliday junction DNA helicase RuvB
MQVSLRPTRLKEFKGKPEIKHNLEIYIKSCLSQNRPLDHCLFYGLPGTGKTSLAHIIANELGRKIKVVQGNSILRNIDIINLVLTLNEFDILFIDEIHAINPQCVELLYSMMEDFVIDINLGKDFNARVTRINVPKFTLIGATTTLGKIIQPLEDRFGIVINLKTYDIKAISEIIKVSSHKLDLNLTKDEIEIIAKNAKGIPRNANRLLKRIKDFRLDNSTIPIKTILRKLQIIEDGLDSNDLAYLKAIKFNNHATGLKTISQLINVDQQTIETKIEPFLIQKQLVAKSMNGRIITTKGLDFIERMQNEI